MADIYSPAAQPGLASPQGPSSDSILQVLSSMAPRDPATANPATTQAMARSRDAITRILERQLKRQEDPFTGLNDVATAAQTALVSRGKTPFGAALEQLDSTRSAGQLRTATALGQQAQRESAAGAKGSMTPYQRSQIIMQNMRFQAQRGDKEADQFVQRVDKIRANLEPEDAVGFGVDVTSDLHDYQQQVGRPISIQEMDAIIQRRVQAGGYRAKQPNLQMQINPITGDKEVFNPRTGATGQSAITQRAPIAAPYRGPAGTEPQLRNPTVMPSASPEANYAPGAVQQAELPPQRAGQVPAPSPGMRQDYAPVQAPQAGAQTPGRVPLPPPAKGIPANVQAPNIKGLPETASRLDAILRAREQAQNVPNALGFQGALIDNLGGIAQQIERFIGAPGALGTERYNVNGVSQARDQFNLLFAKMLPTITGDSSGRYSNFDVQLASKMARFKDSTSSVEQSVGFLTLVRDMEIRALRRQLVLSGEGGQAIYQTFSPEVKQALENPAVVGPDGDAPYDDIKIVGTKVYVKIKGSNQWAEVQR